MKNQKSAYKFNLIDVILIIAIIAVLGAIYYFVSGRNSLIPGMNNNVGNKNEKVQFVIELKTVDKDYIDNLQEDLKNGANVVETVRSNHIGKIVDLQISPAWAITEDSETGKRVIVEYPPINTAVESEEQEPTEEPKYDFYNVKITVEADMQKNEKGFSIDSFNVAIGSTVSFRLPHFVGEGTCVAYKVVNG